MPAISIAPSNPPFSSRYFDVNRSSSTSSWISKGFRGGFANGRYGYLVPENNGAQHGNLVRFSFDDFTASGVTVLDIASVNSALKGFREGFAYGGYGYLVPWENGARI